MNKEEKREKRLAWKAAYLAASPEEKERMLAEKKEEMRIAEENRKREIYEENKARFIQKCDEQIAVLKAFVSLEKIVLEIIRKFDEKCYNKRLEKAVKDAVEKSNKKCCAYLENGRITIRYAYYCGWTDRFTINVVCDENGRIDAEKTLNEYNFDFIEIIKRWKNAKQNYEKVYKKAEKLRKEIETYRRENVFVRDFLKNTGVIGYTNDL